MNKNIIRIFFITTFLCAVNLEAVKKLAIPASSTTIPISTNVQKLPIVKEEAKDIKEKNETKEDTLKTEEASNIASNKSEFFSKLLEKVKKNKKLAAISVASLATIIGVIVGAYNREKIGNLLGLSSDIKTDSAAKTKNNTTTPKTKPQPLAKPATQNPSAPVPFPASSAPTKPAEEKNKEPLRKGYEDEKRRAELIRAEKEAAAKKLEEERLGREQSQNDIAQRGRLKSEQEGLAKKLEDIKIKALEQIREKERKEKESVERELEREQYWQEERKKRNEEMAIHNKSVEEGRERIRKSEEKHAEEMAINDQVITEARGKMKEDLNELDEQIKKLRESFSQFNKTDSLNPTN